jgi:arylsulfatase A-like enzyme
MTSLQHSVLGGFKNGFNVVPDDAPTMAQHMHRAGYQTAVFTSNPNAGRMSGLDRGVDVMREAGVERDFISSVELHEGFWSWRDAYPSEPYWVHFQTTDVHEYETGQPEPVAPFSGLFVNAETRKSYYEDWDLFRDFLKRNPEVGEEFRWFFGPSGLFEDTGVDRVGFFETMRSLYDESMAHQDYQIGRLVERLKAAGEWENTLLIIAADHSVTAALWDLGVLLQDSIDPLWEEPMFRPSVGRVPLIFIWPGHIEGGQRFDQPVSMIDVLPTLLDLVGLPPAEIAQGQSLSPLLWGEDGWEPRPVILDVFRVDLETGELRGVIEVVDGRWGASLEINTGAGRNVPREPRPVTLLLYDLWNDPMALWSLHEERPDLVEKYTTFLEGQLEAHQALAQLFTPSESVALTPEQLETLRALGYIQ